MTLTSMSAVERAAAIKANAELDDKLLAYIKQHAEHGTHARDLAQFGQTDREGRDIDRALQRLRTRRAIRHDPRIGWVA